MELLFKIGFLPIRFVDILDVALVAILLVYLYKLLKGSLAFNIFIGLLFFYIAWQILRALEIKLMASILEAFVSVGVIALLIVFQPEVRRFLLMIGKDNLVSKNKWVRKYFTANLDTRQDGYDPVFEIEKTLIDFSKSKTGALLVFPKTSKLQVIQESGIPLGSAISSELLFSIFEKNSPLHDGAIIISGNKIQAAKCILPVSESQSIPSHMGTRHRASIGITEHSDAIAILVSEESGKISSAKGGQLRIDLKGEELRKVLRSALKES